MAKSKKSNEPVEVEARQLQPIMNSLQKIFKWVNASAADSPATKGDNGTIVLNYNGKRSVAKYGDYIVRHKNGRFSVVKEADFSDKFIADLEVEQSSGALGKEEAEKVIGGV